MTAGAVLALIKAIGGGGGGSSGGGALIANGTTTGSTTVLDKTYAEIYEAVKTTGAYIVTEDELYGVFCHPVMRAYNNSGTYTVEAVIYDTQNDGVSWIVKEYTTSSENGYPSFTVPFLPI